MKAINTVMDKTIQSAVKLISPDSMAFNEENNKQFTIKEFLQSEELKKRICPGDIVLTKTSSNVYGVVRKLMDSEFDHVSVFLDASQVLHISPPRIRVIPSNIFLMRKMEPLIIRPQLTDAEREEFIKRLKSFENQSYDYKGLIQVFGLKTAQNIFHISQQSGFLYKLDRAKEKKRKICTDLIIFSLAQSSPKFMETLKKHVSKLNFAFVGAFSPDDFKYILENDSTAFETIYPSNSDIKELRQESRSNSLQRVKQTFDEWRGEVKIHPKEVQLLRRIPQHLQNQQRIDSLIKNVTNLVSLAHANKLFQPGYLKRLQEKLTKSEFFQHAKFLFNLWSLRNFLIGKDRITKNKVKFIVTVYQIFQSLQNFNLVQFHFEKVYLPAIQIILRKIATYFLPTTSPRL